MLGASKKTRSSLFEIASVLVRFDHVAGHRKRGSRHRVNSLEKRENVGIIC
jgi:hypothetical protein